MHRQVTIGEKHWDKEEKKKKASAYPRDGKLLPGVVFMETAFKGKVEAGISTTDPSDSFASTL